jgi:hypothetical protein
VNSFFPQMTQMAADKKKRSAGVSAMRNRIAVDF